jgi:hypothetical protein
MKQIFAVLGMARSGTSAIASGLNALGVPFGDKLEAPDKLWNPKGFWEDVEIVYNVNRRVMYAIDYSWETIDWEKEFANPNGNLMRIKQYAVKLLRERMQDLNCYGFKDPRTAKIVPFWQAVFKELESSSPNAFIGDLQINYLIVIRNPLSSAYSYQRVTGCDVEEGLLLWLVMHLIPALKATENQKRLVVSYDAMMQQPEQQLMRIKQFFALPDAKDARALEKYTKGFLDKSLQHYEYTRDDLIKHPAVGVIPVCVALYDLLMRLADDTISFDSVAFHTEWEAIYLQYKKMEALYCYMDKVGKKNRELEKELRSLKRSIPWKLTYPLRVIDNLLRARRRQKRHQDKLLTSYAK